MASELERESSSTEIHESEKNRGWPTQILPSTTSTNQQPRCVVRPVFREHGARQSTLKLWWQVPSASSSVDKYPSQVLSCSLDV